MKEDSRVAGPWADRPLYMKRDLICMQNPFPWQQSIIDSVSTQPDDRTISWVVDHGGNVGKSKLVKYLHVNGLAQRIPAGTATQIKTFVIAVGAARAYLVDLPRTSGQYESDDCIFSTLEDLKNGFVISGMYGKVQELIMEPPHLWVFANRAPPVSKMSLDRWHVHYIKDGKLI